MRCVENAWDKVFRNGCTCSGGGHWCRSQPPLASHVSDHPRTIRYRPHASRLSHRYSSSGAAVGRPQRRHSLRAFASRTSLSFLTRRVLANHGLAQRIARRPRANLASSTGEHAHSLCSRTPRPHPASHMRLIPCTPAPPASLQCRRSRSKPAHAAVETTSASSLRSSRVHSEVLSRLHRRGV